MSYKPMTAEEAAKLNVRPDGIYPFEVTDAQNGKTKEKGHPMIALTLSFFDEAGDRFTVKDWLVHSDNRWSEKKCFDFANSTGLTAKYASGEMAAEDCLGRAGFAKVSIEAGKPKADGSGNFPDRNVVKFYTATAAKADSSAKPQPAAAGAPGKTENLDEDVPF